MSDTYPGERGDQQPRSGAHTQDYSRRGKGYCLTVLLRAGDVDPGRRAREAWDVYIHTDDVKALYREYAGAGVEIARPLCAPEYEMTQFDAIDLNGRRLVFAQAISTV